MTKPAFNPNQPFESVKPAFDPSQPFESGPSETESTLRGVASGITAGFDDEIGGAIGGVGRIFGIKNLGAWKPFDPQSKLQTTDEPLSADAIVEAYRSNRDQLRDQTKVDSQVNPGSTIAGNLAGAFVSPVSKLKLGGATKIGGAVKTGAAQGAVFGAGLSDSDLSKGEVGKFAKDVTIDTAISGGVPVALKGVQYTGRLAGKGGKKLFKSLFGVSEKNASKYLKNRARINNAPEIAEIKDQVDDAVRKFSQQIDEGKIKVSQAKEALKEVKSDIRHRLTDTKVDAAEALRQADNMFKEAAADLIQPLKDTKAPTTLAPRVVHAVDQLKQKVIKGSGEALQVLDNTDETVPVQFFKDQLDDSINSLKIGGKDGAAIGKSAKGAIASLEDLRSQIDELPQEVQMRDVKRIIQNLDRDINTVDAAGQFMDPASREKSALRKAADQYLKEIVPEYKIAMRPVAEDSALLSELSKSFGDERKAIGRLGQIANNKGHLDRSALRKLEGITGRSGEFTGPIDRFQRAQGLLKDPKAIEELKRSLPEYESYVKAKARLKRMKPKWTRDQLESALATSKEAKALSQAERTFEEAQKRFKPISKLTPSSTEAKLSSFTKPAGARIETERAVQSLEKLTGRKFTQSLEDRAILDSFMKGQMNGSRNTLLWSMFGGIFGGGTGFLSGGAFGGAIMDKYGPRIGKGLLDAVGTIRDNPSVRTIRSLNIPDSVKKDLEYEFRVWMLTQRERDGE